jgi:hypothetical protein
MLGYIPKKRREQKRKEAHEKELKEALSKKLAHEKELKEALSKKLANYKEPESEPVDDFTMLDIDGKKHRVAKEQITITDISTIAVHKKTRQGEP